jgi:hypothetical protein
MCKKRGRHDEDTEPIDNGEEQFAHKFFNLMKKYPEYAVQMSVPQINLDIDDTGFTLSSIGSLPITKSTMWMTLRKQHLAHYSM